MVSQKRYYEGPESLHKIFVRYTRKFENKNLNSILTPDQDCDVNHLMLDGNKGSYILKHV